MAGARELKTAQGRKVLLGVGIGAAVVLAGYLGLSAWAYGQDTIMPNTSAAGVDVSGMTAEQAQRAVEEELSKKGAAIPRAVELRCGDYIGYLDGGCFRVDAVSTVQAAVEQGRDNFFTAGGNYLAHLLGSGEDVSAQECSLTPAGEEELERQIKTAEGGLGVVPGKENEYVLDRNDATLTMVKGRTIRSVDRQAAKEAVEAAYLSTQGSDFDGETPVVDLITTEHDPTPPEFDGIWREVYTEAKNAQLNKETGEVEEGSVGVTFDVNALKTAYHSAAQGETVVVPLTVTNPTVTRTDLESRLFKDLLGEATSQVSGTSNRKTNVKLAAAACNGVILLPGEVFSYNGTTGSRTADKGYLTAPVYAGSKSVDEVGGGICQPSSTIYYAVLHTPLEIVERHNHTFAVGYVPDGMDATVYYGSLDFQFKNSTNYPLKLVTNSYDKDGKRYLNVKLYGTNETGRYAVPSRTQFDWVAPTTSYVADSTVARGTLVLDREQYAYQGRKAQTTRAIYEKDGTLVEKQDLGISAYKMRPNLYHYNPLDGDPSAWADGKPPAAQASEPVETETPGEAAQTSQGAAPAESAETSGQETPGQSESSGQTETPEDSGVPAETPAQTEQPRTETTYEDLPPGI